ncbi:MAG TPA: hypothetical protein PLM29_07145, partial [Deltaproteobacteria bacterium]|nr:hypothetical protein [Deltaproteobacteria bacterium]
FMGLFMLTSPRGAHKSLEMFARWGISRFSISWKMRNSRKIIHCLQNWGYEVNIYNVPDLEAFLQAVLTMPRSITSYFNFPKWFMDGRQEEKYPGRHHYRKIA